jgi:hypothetical protein
MSSGSMTQTQSGQEADEQSPAGRRNKAVGLRDALVVISPNSFTYKSLSIWALTLQSGAPMRAGAVICYHTSARPTVCVRDALVSNRDDESDNTMMAGQYRQTFPESPINMKGDTQMQGSGSCESAEVLTEHGLRWLN